MHVRSMEQECRAQDSAVSSSGLTVPSEGEVLGSVTHHTDSEGGPGIQLRTSARVSKKLKLDSLAHAHSSSDKKEVSHEEEKKPETVVALESKPRAKRVDWSPEDKVAFFEALNEFGKDIDAIHNYLVQKAKRRGGLEVKTKDQVRFFYYRMSSILIKHISFPTYIKKQTQELYSLINFGELRKKISLSHKKHYEKLSEMIYSGATQLKIRGKARKVRTPLCRALRKLNHIQESSEELRLPSLVTVELRPRTTEGWCRVQSLAQNPRVRSLLPLHRRLETLLSYLHNRWRTHDEKLKEQLVSSGGGVASSGEAVLTVGPKPGTPVTEPTVRLSEVATSSKLSLLAYEQRFHPSSAQVPALLQQLPVIHRSKGRGVKRQRTDSQSEKVGEEGVEMSTAETAPNHLLSLHCITDNAQSEVISPRGSGELVSPVKHTEAHNIYLDSAHCGWNRETAATVRIGDIYMMFGVDAKIQLDYWWERCPAVETVEETVSSCVGDVVRSVSVEDTPAAASGEETPAAVSVEETPVAVSVAHTPSLLSSLNKLLSIAKIEMSKPKGSALATGSDTKVHTPKQRLSKPKPNQDIKKVDTQLKFESVCPLPLDGVFRRPLITPINTLNKPSGGSNLNVDKLRRYCNRRGRPKRLVPNRVSREVPLLPKVPPAIVLPGIQPAVLRHSFKPIAPTIVPAQAVPIIQAAPIVIDVKVAVPLKTELQEEGCEQVPSPPSLSNLLDDLSLPSNCSSRLSTPVPTFEGILGSSDVNMGSPASTREPWITSEVGDLSLSGFSFLNTLDTDMKAIAEESRLSEMDSQMKNFCTDNSSDLNDIIADLTATIKTNTDSN